MYWIYKPAIALFFQCFRIAAWFRTDAKKWVAGRRGWKEQLISFINSVAQNHSQRIWFHAASLGEFEQGRELIELIRKNHPDTILILSFFSPSGYDKCRNYAAVDYVCYFPSDSYHEVESFIEIINPSFVIFVKYDFWFNTLELLNRKKIPFCFISTIFRKNHLLLHPVFRSLLNKLKPAHQIFLQNESSFTLLQENGFHNIQVCGDTRLDRVYKVATEHIVIPGVDAFCVDHRIFIAGSIWESDLKIIGDAIDHALNTHWKIILVPHHTDEATVQTIEKRFTGKTIRYTQLNPSSAFPILIFDQIGSLSRLYKFCEFAYVGGAFGKGIHNILEPASHKKAVCFGPNHHKFQEAKDFIRNGNGFVIYNSNDLNMMFDSIAERKNQIHEIIEEYFQKNLGASQKIYQYLIRNLLIVSS